MRIAHLTATFPPYRGGAGNTAFRFAREQAERGHRVEVFTAPAPGDPPDPGGAIVHRIEPVLAIGNAPLIPSLARLEGFDVVHLHYPFIFGSELTLLGRLRARGRAQALLVHYKNRLVGTGIRGALFEAYERTVAPLLIRAADRVCVLSADHADSVPYLRRAASADPAKLVEMPNGVDAEQFSPGADDAGLRARLGIPDDAIVAAFVATLDRAHHFKRLDLAIEALARLADPRAHLVVAGGGELLDRFRADAVRAGVDERVHFLGAVPHSGAAGGAARRATCSCSPPSRPSRSGSRSIEAMACGLPAIATDYPGVRAVVDPEVTGVLVPRGDPSAVATALRGLIEAGAERRAALGEAGRRRAVARWSWPQLVERMDRAYAEAIAHRRAKSRLEPPDPAGRLLLPALPGHRSAAPGGDGEVAAAARARGHRADHLRLRAQRRAGRRADDGRAALARPAPRRRTGSTRSTTRTPTAVAPHPLSRVVVPEPLALAWAPFARRRALRLARERGFDCVITTSPPESVARPRRGAAAAAGRPGSPTCATGGRSSRLRPRFPTAAQRRLDEWIERRRLGAADAVVCVSEPAAADLRRRGIARTASDPERLGPRAGSRHRRRPRPGCSIPTASRSSTRAASAATAGTPPRWSRGWAGSRARTPKPPRNSSWSSPGR